MERAEKDLRELCVTVEPANYGLFHLHTSVFKRLEVRLLSAAGFYSVVLGLNTGTLLCG